MFWVHIMLWLLLLRINLSNCWLYANNEFLTTAKVFLENKEVNDSLFFKIMKNIISTIMFFIKSNVVEMYFLVVQFTMQTYDWKRTTEKVFCYRVSRINSDRKLMHPSAKKEDRGDKIVFQILHPIKWLQETSITKSAQ